MHRPLVQETRAFTLIERPIVLAINGSLARSDCLRDLIGAQRRPEPGESPNDDVGTPPD